MSHGIRSQAGAVLPVTLFILVIVTLLAVSTMDTSSSGLRIAQNQQSQLQANLVAQQQIESILSTSGWFKTGTGGFQDLEDDDGDDDDTYSQCWNIASGSWEDPDATNGCAGAQRLAVQVSKPDCFGSVPVTGYSAQATLVPETDYWEFNVTVSDPLTGARAVTNQGVRMRMLSGSCTTL